MKREWQIFLTALSFYTRIPIRIDHPDSDHLNESIKYFPIIGFLTGSLFFVSYIFLSHAFGSDLGILFALLTGILLTGALHEDGFADVCDGFGGGWTKPKILEIMKDSRVGTYGLIGLIFLLLIKFFAIKQLVALPSHTVDCTNA
jgi:adenosylcobinamide-GDP ribazoletransferase